MKCYIYTVCRWFVPDDIFISDVYIANGNLKISNYGCNKWAQPRVPIGSLQNNSSEN